MHENAAPMEPIALHRNRETGWIEVICGSMFSGKTEELIRRVRRAIIARQKVQVFKPAIDERYSIDSVGSHSGQRLRSFQIRHSDEIPALVGDAAVVGIDRYGESAPANALFPLFGFTARNVADTVRKVLSKSSKE